MPSINLNIDQYHLNIPPKARPMKQRPRKFALECQQVINDKVDRLQGVWFVIEV